MKPEGSFIAECLAAQHCPELLRGTYKAVNPLDELAVVVEQLPALLQRHLSELCAGAKLEVRVGEPYELQANAGNEKRGDPMLNSMIALGPKEVMMIASVPQRAILSILDMALGGTGQDCEVPAGKLPLSVQMMFGRFEKVLSGVLAKAMDLIDGEQVKIKAAGAMMEAGMPFAGCKRTVLTVEVTIAGTASWELSLVFPGSTLANLFAGRTARGEVTSEPRDRSPANALAEPFGGIPVPLRAVLVDMAVPVSMLSRLTPGMVIPVFVSRSVPLIAGEQIIAQGLVGETEDRAALQLTKIFEDKEI